MVSQPSSRDEAVELAHRRAKIRLPDWLWGGDVAGIGVPANWRLIPSGQQADTWDVCLQERFAKKRPRHVEAIRMGHRRNIGTSGAFSLLRSLPVQDDIVQMPHEEILAALDRATRKHEGLGPAMYVAGVATMACPQVELPETVRQILLHQFLPALPDAEAWLVRLSPAVSYRLVMCRVLMMLEDDPRLLETISQDFQGFNSARGLLTDITVGLQAYLGPGFLSATPFVWGFGAQRIGGVVAYLFGDSVPGRASVAMEPLQVFHPQTSRELQSRTQLSPRHYSHSLQWWTMQLNDLFAEATDPCNYLTQDGFFEPRKQLETVMSVEQTFRNIQSISALDRDAHARRVLALDTLDTLEGLKLLDFRQMCTLSVASSAVESLRRQLPSDVAAVLLPRAQKAVDGLLALQGGFFLRSRVTDKGIRLPDDRHGERVHSLESATAAWLRVLRNAGHGFGSGRRDSARDDALLLAHDASVPDGIADLAYLYVLRLLAEPSLLRRLRPTTARR